MLALALACGDGESDRERASSDGGDAAVAEDAASDRGDARSDAVDAGADASDAASPETTECGEDDLCRSLAALGVDIEKSPRLGPDGKELPESFNPFGAKKKALFPIKELFVGGAVALEPERTVSISERHDDIDEADGEILFGEADPWASGALRTAVAGDFDGDGREEVAGLFVDADGRLALHEIQDQDANFATRDVVLGDFEVLSMGAAAGDFDGDGRAEIAIAIGQTAGTRLLYVDDAGTTYDLDSGLVQTLARDVQGSVLRLELAAGNLDYDGSEELVLVVSEVVGDYRDGNAVASYYIYDDAAAGRRLLRDGYVQGRDGAVHSARVADAAVGDIDGDGVGEVVLGGLVSHDPAEPVEYILVALDDRIHDFAELSARHTSDFRDESDNVSPPRYEHIIVNTLDFDGDLATDIQVNQFVFANFSASDAPWTVLYQIENAVFQQDQGFVFSPETAAMAVGDLNGDKRDDVALVHPSFHLITIGASGVGENSEPTFGVLETIDLTGSGEGSRMLLTANVDSDTALLEYSEAESDLVFTEPIVIAALAAPPCQDGIGQNTEACQTSFGTADSMSVSAENSVTLSASVSVGVSFEDRLFSQSALEISATGSIAATQTQGTAYSVEKSVVFTSGPLEDAVVFTTIPYDRYSYRIVSHPLPELVGETTTIAVPREPVTLMVERGFYNAHVAPGSPLIDESVFAHQIGERESYPTVSDKDELLSLYGGLESEQVGVGQGNGQVEVSLDVSDEISSGKELELGFELEVSLTAGGVMGGFTVGASSANSLSVTSGTSTSYAGAVGAIDAEHFADNRYQVGLFTYVYRTPDGREFEVLNFWQR